MYPTPQPMSSRLAPLGNLRVTSAIIRMTRPRFSGQYSLTNQVLPAWLASNSSTASWIPHVGRSILLSPQDCSLGRLGLVGACLILVALAGGVRGLSWFNRQPSCVVYAIQENRMG